MSEPESLVEITPSQIIGEEAYMHLVFEGYEVVDAAQLSTLRSRCETLEAERDEAEHYRSEWERVCGDWKQATLDATTARDEAVAALGEARKALKPFARIAKDKKFRHVDSSDINLESEGGRYFPPFDLSRALHAAARAAQPSGKEKG